jgi:hypothetical protein
MNELSREARMMLDATAGADDPSTEDCKRIDARLRTRLGTSVLAAAATVRLSGGSTAAAAPAAAGGVGGGLLAKVVLATVIVAGSLCGGVALVWHRAAPAPASLESRGAAVQPDAPRAPASSARSIPGPPAGPSPPLVERGDRSIAAARARSIEERPGPSKAAARAMVRPAQRSSAPGDVSAAAAAGPPMGADVDPLAVEVDLIRRAHAALQDGDPARALGLLDQHAGAFPNGSLAEERSVARIKALCLLGRTPEARVAARQFRRQTPRSQYLSTVQASCGGSGTIE